MRESKLSFSVPLQKYRLTDGLSLSLSHTHSATYDVSHFISWNRAASQAKEVPDGAALEEISEQMDVDEGETDDVMSPRTIHTHDLLLYSGRDT